MTDFWCDYSLDGFLAFSLDALIWYSMELFRLICYSYFGIFYFVSGGGGLFFSLCVCRLLQNSHLFYCSGMNICNIMSRCGETKVECWFISILVSNLGFYNCLVHYCWSDMITGNLLAKSNQKYSICCWALRIYICLCLCFDGTWFCLGWNLNAVRSLNLVVREDMFWRRWWRVNLSFGLFSSSIFLS